MFDIPDHRLRKLNALPINENGDFVVYWMISYRRLHWNFSLDRAVIWAQRLGKPLLILEALRCGHKWACDRFHSFVLDGMKNNYKDSQDTGVFYYPYLEQNPGAGKGLLRELSKKACIIITDFFCCFFLPRMIAATASRISCRMEQVDSIGLLPLFNTDQIFVSAFSFRRYLQKHLPKYILEAPSIDPLTDHKLITLKKTPDKIFRAWPPVPESFLMSEHRDLSWLPINHNVFPTENKGGSQKATSVLRTFLDERLNRYASDRNDPDLEATSELSPYLHWGHIGVHEIFWKLMHSENWTPDKISMKASGKKNGWWGVSKDAEAFLDELITWRELGFNMCSLRNDYDSYESLPDWAKKTLFEHKNDYREHLYTIEDLENAATHDPIWNSAQRELLSTGKIHNYLRMLWGKKILEWTSGPAEALQIMIELNNKYGLDGRDPNSYTGIFWILGRYDRPWGPERSVFGKIRYMSSKRTQEKLKLDNYLKDYVSD